mmetsp:Transcript_60186/g.105468  ORF Transcript_60186/g.105468 Transcript_60186/m.105468 type:complete len:947 (-) Transcript_60186:153-2993(-)
MATMLPGTLVTLSGMKGKAKVVGDGVAMDLNGMKAQLIEYVPAAGKWVASTFSGEMIGVDPKFLKPLGVDGLDGFDFIMGPGTDPAGLAAAATEVLSEKGYATISVILAAKYLEEIVSAAKDLEAGGSFSRLPRGFDSGYLGMGSKGKIFKVEGSMPAALSGTQLPSQEKNMTVLSEALAPFMKEAFGFTIMGKTPAMLAMPITDLEDEIKYYANPPTNKEADTFLALMARRKMCMLQFMGPASGKLTLLPKSTSLPQVTIDAKPNTVVLLVAGMYDYSYEATGETVTLLSWFISDNNSYRVTTSGTSSALAVTTSTFLPGIPPPRGEAFAITGIGAKDPANINDEGGFWTAVNYSGVDGFQMIPSTRFDTDAYIDWEDQNRATRTGKSYCRHQGHVDGLDWFDNKFFNIPDAETWGMDPCQRTICDVGWGALENAGFDAQTLRKDSAHVGVYVGISGSDWPTTCDQSLEFPKFVQSPNGQPETFIANRFSFVMNLKGPSFIANTACSASLVAANNAKTQMKSPFDPLEGALVAGINLNLAAGTWIGNCAGNMLSFIGRSFSFSVSADGYGRGEGSSAVYIKRAEFSKDIYATMMGSNANSDGRSASLTAPNGPAQQRLLRSILDEVKISTNECDQYEAHGTGTSLGDPIELGACIKVLGKNRAEPLVVSCHKGNFGHLEGGAGISGFIKCVLQCGHLMGCPINHLNVLNPNITLDGFPGLLTDMPTLYRCDSAYVGVSGFGYGGTNAHCMMYGKKYEAAFQEKVLDPRQLRLENLKKVRAAPPPEINATADSFEDWTSTGIPHLTAKEDDAFYVDLLPGGKTQWREIIEPDAPAEELVPFIQGSFNSWSADMLEPSEAIEGLFTCEVDIGASGEESFQIVLDADPDLALYPVTPFCSRKSGKVGGPDVPPSQDFSWVIKGAPETTYRVEFFMSDSVKTVSWFKTE